MNMQERKKAIQQSWSENTTWSDRTSNRDFNNLPNYAKLTAMITRLVATGNYSRVVEVGCGDGKYLEYLSRKLIQVPEWIATDIPGPRIERAITELSSLNVQAMDLIECQMRYNTAGTLFVAANVFGNIVPDDMTAFFDRLNVKGTALAFAAGGLPIEADSDFELRPSGITFDHNIFRLIKRSGLSNLEYEVSLSAGRTRRAGYWVSGVVA